MHRLATSLGTTLAVRHYAPVHSSSCGVVIVLLHGLLASAEIFDVPGLEELSLARFLAGRGFQVVSYDQRGTGDSTAESVDFGLAEHSWVDLPAVLRFALDLTGSDQERLVLGGHSLGGTLIYLQQVAARKDSAAAAAVGPVVHRAFTLASPAAFDPRWWPWNLIRRGGHELVLSLDANADGMVSRQEFVAGQTRLRWPRIGGLVRPGMIAAAIKVASALPWLGGALRYAPLPTFIYGRRDFSNWAFWRLLRSRALDKAPIRLFDELVDATANGGCLRVRQGDLEVTLPEDLSILEGLRILTVTSRQDGFVPWQAAQTIHSYIRNAEQITTEERFAMPSGHAGYLFRHGLAEGVRETVARFVSETRT